MGHASPSWQDPREHASWERKGHRALQTHPSTLEIRCSSKLHKFTLDRIMVVWVRDSRAEERKRVFSLLASTVVPLSCTPRS